MSRRQRKRRCGRLLWLLPLATLPGTPGLANDLQDSDLREIRIGMAASDLPKAGYADFACANEPQRTLPGWERWPDCPAGAAGTRAIRFGYDPASSRDGTMVAGHPVILTLAIDDAGQVTGLHIETDPKARLYIRKKAFLLGVQAKFRYGVEGWTCTEGQPSDGEQPVGGVYLKEKCTKTVAGRSLVVERKLFRQSNQDAKSFVDETKISIQLAKG
jgi:hypothetical protein